MYVLIVDDEIRKVQAMIKRFPWGDFGFEAPFAAYSMNQAQIVFSQHPVDLMLCDIEMPHGNGLELFEWVKSYYPGTECIFVTCHDDYDYMRSAILLGSFDYILKPINYDILKDSVSKAAERISAKEHTIAMSQLPMERATSTNPYVDQILKFISEHLTENIPISDIAESVHLNDQYIMRLFKKEVGCSILQYITNQRIALAMKYLTETDLSITEISIRSGFDNDSYFRKLFKRITQTTPGEFRKLSGL